MTINKIIVGGASITNSPWFTWADFLHNESGIDLVKFCHYGAGNECIASLIVKNSSLLDANTLVVVMLTNFDKFDWYVNDTQFEQLQTEQNQPYKLSNCSGFWSTGSWFPLKKEHYHRTFYTDDYFCAKSIQQILLLQSVCANTGAKLEILFDSPIWTHTERCINELGEKNLEPDNAAQDFLSSPLSKIWAEFLTPDMKNISTTSLIGFCWEQHLAWHNQTYRGHPPSGSHYQYYQKIVRPRLSQYLKLTQAVAVDKKIKIFDKAWNNGTIVKSRQ